MTASFRAQNYNYKQIGYRLSSLRDDGTGQTGLAAGDPENGIAFWANAFGGIGTEDSDATTNGYELSTVGLAVGADTKRFLNNGIVGLSFSHSITDIEQQGNRIGNETELIGQQVSLYTSTDVPNYYINGAVGLGLNQYQTVRKINFATIDRTALGDYDGYQYSAKIDGGYYILQGSSFTLIPITGLEYARLDVDSYTETGADSLNLTIDEQSYESFEAMLGVRLQKKHNWAYGILTSEVRAAYEYDFIGDNENSDTAFSAGINNDFNVPGPTSENSTYTAGASITLETEDQLQVTANYDAEIRSKYLGHSGNLNLRVQPW